MAGFATAVNPEFDPWQAQSVPPTYDAYQEMLAGDSASWRFEFADAAAHYLAAARLDSNYVGALTGAAAAFALGGDCAGVDSVSRRVQTLVVPIPPAQRAQLEHARAKCLGDPEGVRQASLASLAAAPRSMAATVLASIAAAETNRPAEALDILLRTDPRRLGVTGRRLAVYLDFLAGAYHGVGQYERQLATARGGLRDVPGYAHLESNEAIALAALGRAEEAESLAVAWLTRRAPGGDWEGQKAQCVALELTAHGQPEASRRLMNRVVAWYQQTGWDDAATSDRMPCLWFHFSPRYYAGQWNAARQAYEHLLAGDSTNFVAHAALDALAARRGDRETVRRMDRWLTARTGPEAIYARARAASLLGDRERALLLLRQAHDQGFLAPDHIDPDLAPLRADSVYRELFRPRG
jgi:tetratricopeptide (TPR) repeat protein